MIPKIIHYCWFGGNPLPPLAIECIASWKKFFPDYEIKEWNESNFDVNIIPYTKEAYSAKKYAFVSDYARFWILYNYGGIYFDTDVEVIRSLDDIIAKGNFLGFERNPDGRRKGLVNPGLGFAISQRNVFLKNIMDLYSTLHFIKGDGTFAIEKTIVHYTTDVLDAMGLNRSSSMQVIDDITIYPADYFAPIHFVTKRLHITKNTRTIHRYMASWGKKRCSMKQILRNCLPEWLLIMINKIKKENHV